MPDKRKTRLLMCIVMAISTRPYRLKQQVNGLCRHSPAVLRLDGLGNKFTQLNGYVLTGGVYAISNGFDGTP